jgi:D-glycero-D-manno-heptose 1,7-bisphosphate phosphatase
MTRRRFILLDRDGTIIVERHYLSDPQQVELISGAALGLGLLRQMGFGLVVITNQSGIGRGLFDRARLDLIHRRLYALLAAEGVYLNGIYFCPHTPEDECSCRKPKPGLVELAATQLGFDPQASYLIGDQPCDIELGQRIGATTFLVRTGYGAQVAAQTTVNPDCVVEDLWEAAQIIKRLLATDERTAIDGTQYRSS